MIIDEYARAANTEFSHDDCSGSKFVTMTQTNLLEFEFEFEFEFIYIP
jgi:hypothetical protein